MPKDKAPQTFTTKVSRGLEGTPKDLQSTKAMFFAKGVILVIFGLLLMLAQPWIANYLAYVFAGFAVIDGLAIIASALMSERINKSFPVMGIILGGLIIIAGVTPLVFPAVLIPALSSLIMIAIALDALFTISSLLFLVKTAGATWWAVIAGLISVVFVISYFVYGTMANSAIWLETYGLAQGIFYCLTPLIFAQAKPGRR